MALNILQEHKQVFLTLLDADNAAPALVVLDGKVPDGMLPPYVLVYIGFRVPDASAEPDKVGLEEAAANALYAIATCHSVGGNVDAALAVGGRVRAALLGAIPALTARSAGPIKRVDGSPVKRDETTGVVVQDLVDVYEFLSLPS